MVDERKLIFSIIIFSTQILMHVASLFYKTISSTNFNKINLSGEFKIYKKKLFF